MADHTHIEWTDATVNFWWGCTKVGPGCDHCYAEKLNNFRGNKQWGVGAPRTKIKSAVALIHRLDNDYSEWSADYHCGIVRSARRRVFIQSMSDLFDLEVPAAWFAEAWQHIRECERLEIQIVTKRITAVEKRLAEVGCTAWPKHAGLIITVCNQPEAERDIPRLLALKHKFSIPWVGLSIEPMLGPIDLKSIPWGHARALSYIDWVIGGGESGPKARATHPDWARSLRDQCAASGVPFLFKQWGEWCPRGPESLGYPSVEGVPRFRMTDAGHNGQELGAEGDNDVWMNRAGKKAAGRLLDGIEHNAFPAVSHA